MHAQDGWLSLIGPGKRALLGTLLLLALWGGHALPVALAQQGIGQQAVPQPIYYNAFAPFYAGNYRDAAEAFRAAARLGIRSTEGRWIDAICYHTMMGECYYHLGDLVQAQEQYDTALQIAVAHDGWMLRVEFPQTLQASASSVRQRITWGVSGRNTGLANLPDKMLTLQGRLDNQNVVRMGGVIAPPQFHPVRVQEIVRCTALALRRRRELLGPTARFDPFTDRLVATFSQRSAPANHWSQAWCSIHLGLAYASAGKVPEAMQELLAGLTIGGMDHPLTAPALLELGKLQVETNQIEKAAVSFAEAGFAAAAFGDADVLEEAFRWGLIVHLLRDGKNLYPPLVPAVQYARTNDYYPLEISLATLAAENFAVLRQTAKGVAALGTVQRLVGRRELGTTDVAGRYHYIAALLAFQGGDLNAGQASLNLALAFQKTGSRRLFQIVLADKLFLAGRRSRDLNDLFAAVLRDPQPADWALDPQEALAVSTTHKPAPIEHWFEMQLEGRNIDKALEIADFARRQRFYATIPLGGRLIALRWILEAPPELLGEVERLQRKDIEAKYPHYVKLSQAARALRDKVTAQPLVPADDEGRKAREADLAELGKLSILQEAALREISLRRDASNFVFPPVRPAKDIQVQLSAKQAALVVFNTSLATHVFAVARDKYSNWRLDAPEKVARQLAAFLRDLGQFDRNQAVPAALFKEEKWRDSGAELLKLLMPGAKPESLLQFDELILVPDGILWYVPFEALSLAEPGGGSLPLIKKVKVRYAPTLSLGVPDARGFAAGRQTAVVPGRLFLKDDEEMTAASLAALRGALPGTMVLPEALPGPSALVAKFCDRAIVLADLEESPRTVYDWSPLVVDRGKATGTLAAWQALPFGGPDQIVLPGFHTPAEYGLKRGGNGDEIFLNALAFLSTGARTIMLSRWRVGGQSSQDLVKSFAQELPHAGAAAAWQRSVQLAMVQEYHPSLEPRVAAHSTDGPVKGEHPFFWGGYMVIDTGAVPAGEEPAPAAKAAEPLKVERK